MGTESIRKFIPFILIMAILLLLLTCSNEPLNPLSEDAENAIKNLGNPKLVSYFNSDCLDSTSYTNTGDGNDPDQSSYIVVEINGTSITVIHKDAVYNCCIDRIEVTLIMRGNILKLIEKEIVTMPCDCVCMYDIETVIDNLASGDYVIQIWNADQTELLAEKEISI